MGSFEACNKVLFLDLVAYLSQHLGTNGMMCLVGLLLLFHYHTGEITMIGYYSFKTFSE